MTDRINCAQWGSAARLAEDIRSGQLSATAVVEFAIARIKVHNEKLNAFVAVDEDGALAAARRIDDAVRCGSDPGPLAGVPIGVKDLEDCRGFKTTHGSRLFANTSAAAQDSLHVARLRAAGAVPIGKTAASEFGFDSATNTALFGVTRNPWNLELTPGGSSGGSAAAVSSALVPMATSTDYGGSTRSPAANAGLVGLKASRGLVPTTDSCPFTVPGVLTTNVCDTARYLDIVANERSARSFEAACESLTTVGLSAAWSSDLGYLPVDTEVERVAEAAASSLVAAAGLQLKQLNVRLTNIYPEFVDVVVHGISRIVGDQDAGLVLVGEKIRNSLSEFSPRWPQAKRAIEGRCRALLKDIRLLFRDIDVLLTPVTVCPPFRAEGRDFDLVRGRSVAGMGVENFPLWANAVGAPSISVPAGFTQAGAPVGLLISGRPGADATVLRLARVLELAKPWPIFAPDFMPGD
jgi:aspartyl-tRNA(Asn)/glutamyl-tRNA(Gln) amidotransferase subunit A